MAMTDTMALCFLLQDSGFLCCASSKGGVEFDVILWRAYTTALQICGLRSFAMHVNVFFCMNVC